MLEGLKPATFQASVPKLPNPQTSTEPVNEQVFIASVLKPRDAARHRIQIRLNEHHNVSSLKWQRPLSRVGSKVTVLLTWKKEKKRIVRGREKEEEREFNFLFSALHFL
ncbi:unnamed protein product [Pleuronectes platessa]|uniref:Uncharacterized protein n=1 Tax=Pleuronectes platessa TaxID=8262 RepID=A0A9N7UJR3_PLEPL|nr:unnamed protein product [Pleuronectes platessa]